MDPARIGMAGVSLGGMHTWLCAALDKRVAAAAPLIGVQGFQWAISNQAYHGRVDSLRRAFDMIAKACGKVCGRRSLTVAARIVQIHEHLYYTRMLCACPGVFLHAQVLYPDTTCDTLAVLCWILLHVGSQCLRRGEAV